MRNSKFISLLSSLNKEDLKGFESHLRIGCRANSKVLQLFELIKGYYPDFSKKSFRKEILGKKLYRKAKFSDEAFRLLQSELTQKLKKFLAREELDFQPLAAQHLLSNSLQRRGLMKAYESEMSKALEMLEKGEDLNPDKRYFRLVFREDYMDFKQMNRLPVEEDLNLTDHELDLFFTTQKLRLACYRMTHDLIISKTESSSNTIEMAEKMVHMVGTDDISVRMHYSIFNMLRNPDSEKYYHLLIENIQEDISAFSDDEKRDIFGYAQNFCIGRINEGNIEYSAKLFELYKSMLTFELLFEDSFLPQFHYRNIVFIALRNKAYNWALDFTEKYRSKLRSEVEENAYTYNMASYHFATGNFDESISLLQRVEFNGLVYALNARVLLMKNFYVTNEIEAFHSLAQSFRAYLTRLKNVDDTRKRLFQNFIRAILKLEKAKYARQAVIVKVKREIEELTHLADKRWLLEMAENQVSEKPKK